MTFSLNALGRRYEFLFCLRYTICKHMNLSHLSLLEKACFYLYSLCYAPGKGIYRLFSLIYAPGKESLTLSYALNDTHESTSYSSVRPLEKVLNPITSSRAMPLGKTFIVSSPTVMPFRNVLNLALLPQICSWGKSWICFFTPSNGDFNQSLLQEQCIWEIFWISPFSPGSPSFSPSQPKRSVINWKLWRRQWETSFLYFPRSYGKGSCGEPWLRISWWDMLIKKRKC